MILLEREDVERIGLSPHPFLVEWDLNDPVQFAEGTKADWADIPAPGPFLLVVTDEYAWAGQQAESLYQVAQKRADPINLRRWRALADLYAEEMGISRQSLVLRYSAMMRFLREGDRKGGFFPWSKVYHWPEGGDLMWSALVHGRHPWLEVREHEGERQVRCR